MGMNVYEDLGFPDAAEMKVKSRIVSRMQTLIKLNKASMAAAAKVAGVEKKELGQIFKGQFHTYTVQQCAELCRRITDRWPATVLGHGPLTHDYVAYLNTFQTPVNERWLHTPEMKTKLAKARAWMRSNPRQETDLDALEAAIAAKREIDVTMVDPHIEARDLSQLAARLDTGEHMPEATPGIEIDAGCVGSSFDDFLRDEGIFEEVQAAAVHRVMDGLIAETAVASKIRLTPWDAANHLRNEEDIEVYLRVCRAEQDPELMAAALEDVARARIKWNLKS
jgi:predicted XRE-type DNA-binding protein